VLVQKDSPLRWLHELEAARIEAGAPGSPRATTAAALFQALSVQPTELGGGHDAPLSASVSALLQGQVDAVLVVGPDPGGEVAALPPAERGALRALSLNADAPASRDALRTFLPLNADTGLDPKPIQTLGELSFLVVVGQPAEGSLQRLGTAWCAAMPALRARPGGRWRHVQPELQLQTGWPDAGAIPSDCALAQHPTVPSPRSP
jgi:hypothetical protein